MIKNLEEKIIEDVIDFFNKKDMTTFFEEKKYYNEIFFLLRKFDMHLQTRQYIDFFFKNSDLSSLEEVKITYQKLIELNIPHLVPMPKQFLWQNNHLFKFENFMLLNFSIDSYFKSFISKFKKGQSWNSLLDSTLLLNLTAIYDYLSSSPVNEDIMLSIIIQNILINNQNEIVIVK